MRRKIKFVAEAGCVAEGIETPVVDPGNGEEIAEWCPGDITPATLAVIQDSGGFVIQDVHGCVIALPV